VTSSYIAETVSLRQDSIASAYLVCLAGRKEILGKRRIEVGGLEGETSVPLQCQPRRLTGAARFVPRAADAAAGASCMRGSLSIMDLKDCIQGPTLYSVTVSELKRCDDNRLTDLVNSVIQGQRLVFESGSIECRLLESDRLKFGVKESES
jgi:hypothetical protein